MSTIKVAVAGVLGADVLGAREVVDLALVISRGLIEHLVVLQVRSAVADILQMTSRFAYMMTRVQPSSVMWWHKKGMLPLVFVPEARPFRPDLTVRMDWAGTGHVLVLQKFRD